MGLLSANVKIQSLLGGWELPAQLHCKIPGLAVETPNMIQALWDSIPPAAAGFFTFNHSVSEHRHGVWGHLCDRFILRPACNAVEGAGGKACRPARIGRLMRGVSPGLMAT